MEMARRTAGYIYNGPQGFPVDLTAPFSYYLCEE
jgi:hypothetical protein